MKTHATWLAGIILLLSSQGLWAQAKWQKLASLPEGASVVDLAVDKNNNLYALTYYAGQIFYSTNNGISWSELPGSGMISNIVDIEIDKVSNTLYVGTLYGGLFWTTNKGQSWQNETFYTIPVSGDHAYIATTARKPNSSIIVCNEPGIFSSTVYQSQNGGASFQTYTAVFSTAFDLAYLNDGTLLAGTENGVFQSTDNGMTWNFSNTGIPNMAVSSILEKPQSSKIFAAVNFNVANNDTSGCGVFVSVDGGSSWADASSGMIDCSITSLAMDSATGDLYATFYGGVYRSVNDGQSWTAVSAGLGQDDNTSIAANSSGLFTGSRKRGVAFSGNPSAGWNNCNSGIIVQTVTGMNMDQNGGIMVLDGSNTGVHKFNGSSWSVLNNGLPSSSGRKMVRDHNGVMYASYISTTHCLFKSTDNGNTWSQVTTLPIPSNIYWSTCPLLKVDAHNNLYVVFEVSAQAGYQPPKVYRSSDAGATWTLVYTLDQSTYININDIDLAGDSTVYITANDFGGKPTVLFSQQWDTTFNVLPLTFTQMNTTAELVLDWDDSLYMMQDNILYKQDIAGQWQTLNSSAWDSDYGLYPTRLYVDKQNNFYVTSQYDGVYYSSDDGKSWSDVSNGLPVYSPPLTGTIITHIYDLCFDNNNVPFALSTDYQSNGAAGVYKYAPVTTPTNVTTGLTDPGSKAGFVFEVFPNPAIDHISIISEEKEEASIQLYDTYGRLVKQISSQDDTMQAMDLTDLPAGVYFVKYDGLKYSAVKTIVKQNQ